MRLITIVRLIKIILVAFFALLLMLQFLSFPGQFRYMAEQEPENAGWRWPLTIIVFLVIAAIEVVVVCLWKLINNLSRLGDLKERIRFVDISLAAMSFIWLVIFVAWVGLLSIADDPGLPVVVTVVLCGVTVVLLLYAFYRTLLVRRLTS